MNKLKMEKRMVVCFRNLDAHWRKDAFNMGRRFMQVAAQMQPDDYLGFDVVSTRDQGYQVGVFANAHARISFIDCAWIFENYAAVEELSELPEKEFEEEKQYLYVVERQATVKVPRLLNQNDRNIRRCIEEFADILSSNNASLRIVARTGQENGRGSIYISLSQMMTFDMELSIVRLFPGTVIREVQGCNDEICITNWLTQSQMISGMMGMIGMLKKHDEHTAAQNLIDDERFDVNRDKFDVIDEEETSHGEENTPLPRHNSLGELYYHDLCSEDCPIPGDTSIDELEFSESTYQCLKMHGIKTAAALFALTEVDLHNIRLNEDGMWEIRDKRKSLISMSRREKEKKKVDYSEMLSDLVGLKNVKEQVERVVSFSKLKQEMILRQKNCDGMSLNIGF